MASSGRRPRPGNLDPQRALQLAFSGFEPATFRPASSLSNSGSDSSPAFIAHTPGYTAHLTAQEMEFHLRSSPEIFRLRLSGANRASEFTPADRLPGSVNYFLGRDPRAWRTGVSRFASLRAPEIYPGIALEMHQDPSGIEQDFLLAPGADPRQIQISLFGPRHLRLDSQGALRVDLPARRQLLFQHPIAWQMRAGRRKPVAVRYGIRGRGFGFRFGSYDHRLPLIIDPTISITYTTFFGGGGADVANGVALDPSGNTYIGGNTSELDFPETTTQAIGPRGADDLFFAKFDTTKSGPASLLYLTFIGGSANDDGGQIAVDPVGDLDFSAITTSLDFPVTDGSMRHSGPNDLIAGRLDPTGALAFATYFGGSGSENTQQALGITGDVNGNFFITSDTSSTDLPITSGAFRAAYGGGLSDGFLVKYTSTGELAYCSYLGINAQVGSAAVALDALGNAYLAGFTSAPPDSSFPVQNAFQPVYPGGALDGFVIELNPAGHGQSDLVYATYLGGSVSDKALGIAVDTDSPPNTYVTGLASSPDFPTNGTLAPFQSTLNGSSDAFLTVLAQSSTGLTSLTYSTYLGGQSDDNGVYISVPAPNTVYVAGVTSSLDFPAPGTLQGFSGSMDVFLSRFDTTMAGASSLLYSTLLGGNATAAATGLAATITGDIYLTGSTISTDFPQAANSNNGVQTICTSCGASPPLSDAFLTALFESGAPAPQVVFQPAGVQFGQINVGQAAPPVGVVLKNSGTDTLTLDGFSITGPNSVDFTQTNSCPSALDPGASCTIAAMFTPSVAAVESATLELSSNAPGSPQQLALQGTGLGPEISIVPTSLNFGDQVQGTTSSPMSVTVTNSGTAALDFTVINILGTDTADFQFTQDSCGTILLAGNSCVIGIAFAPKSVGTFNANLTITDNSNNVTTTSLVPLTGTGTTASPLISISPTSLNFGGQVIGTISGAQNISVQNTGSLPLQFTGISIAGTDPLDFGFQTSNTTCPVLGGSLDAGSSCNIAVNFSPTAAGARSAEVLLSDNAPGSPQAVALTGTGLAPAVLLTPAALTYPAQTVGTTSAAQSVTLANTGNGALSINSITITGADPSDFAQSNNCPSSLDAGKSCVVQVTFTPTAAGARAASLSFSDDAIPSPQTASLTGTGIMAAFSFSPSSAPFGGQLTTTASAPLAILATNISGASLGSISFSFTGANASDFIQTNDCGTTLSAGASCTIMLTFQPVAAGLRNASLQVMDNSPSSPQIIALSGTGTDFQFGAAPGGSLTAAVTPGQTATYSLQLNPLDGFTGDVSVTCSSTLSTSTCSTSASTLTATSSTAVPFTVMVATTAMLPPRSFPRTGLWILFVLALAAALIFVWKEFHQGRELRLARCLPVAAFALLLLMAACGGGGGGGSISNPPPANFAVTLSGSSSGVPRTLLLTLTLQ